MVSASLCVGFTLPGMMELPGSFSGIADFAQARTGSGCEPAHVIGDLHQRAGQRFERSVSEDQGVVAGQGLELVRRADEGLPRERRNLGRRSVGELRMCVQPGAHRGAAEGQLVKAGQGMR